MSAWQAWLMPWRAAALIREQRAAQRLLVKTLAIVLRPGTLEGYDNVIPIRRPRCD